MSDAHTRKVTEEVFAERRRQVDELGYTETHDDQWTNGQMSAVAARLSKPATESEFTYRQRLVIAAAYLIAEIERLDRSATAERGEEEERVPAW